MSKTKSCSIKSDWHREDIKAAIRKEENLSVRAFAKKKGINPQTFYNVFRSPYPRFEKLIGDYIGVPPEEIWPSRYQYRRSA